MKTTRIFGMAVVLFSFGVAPIADLAAQSFEFESRVGFPDFRFMEVVSSYQGRVFVLSDNYPVEPAPLHPEVEAILKIDYQTDPLAYAMAVRDYVFKGNIHGGSLEDDFMLQNNSVGYGWYHVPWQHWGSTGREGYHGLTREGPLAARTLGSNQKDASSAYAVGFYNEQGGYAIGQVWPSVVEGPDLSRMIAGDGFARGTVAGKFLFTVFDSSQVSYLAKPLPWTAYIFDCDMPGKGDCNTVTTHSTQTVNLLQMDIMVKDPRATDSNGWVFGTFVYNGDLREESPYRQACMEINGPSKNWCNLMPVGLMWGNDPTINHTFVNQAPTRTMINSQLKQTWINPDSSLPPMHLGFNSRLNGPADNPASSCMSCHSTAQYPSVSAIMPQLSKSRIPIPSNQTPAHPEWMHWFRNFQNGEIFDQGLTVGFDFSMQLARSIAHYIEYRATIQDGHYALEFWMNQPNYKLSRGVNTPTTP